MRPPLALALGRNVLGTGVELALDHCECQSYALAQTVSNRKARVLTRCEQHSRRRLRQCQTARVNRGQRGAAITVSLAIVLGAAALIGRSETSHSSPASSTSPTSTTPSAAEAGDRPSTDVPSTTRGPRGASDSPSPSKVPRLVPVVPSGFAVTGAEELQSGGSVYQNATLWAQRSGTATEGPWVVAFVSPHSANNLPSTGRDVPLPGTTATAKYSTTGDRSDLAWQYGDDWDVFWESGGIGFDDMVALAATVTVVDGAFNLIPTSATSSLRRVLQARPAAVSPGPQYAVWTSFSRPDLGRSIQFLVRPPSQPVDAVFERFFLDQTIDLRDGVLRYGIPFGGVTNDYLVDRGDVVVAISSDLPPDQVVLIADSLHLAGDAEWNELLRRRSTPAGRG